MKLPLRRAVALTVSALAAPASATRAPFLDTCPGRHNVTVPTIGRYDIVALGAYGVTGNAGGAAGVGEGPCAEVGGCFSPSAGKTPSKVIGSKIAEITKCNDTGIEGDAYVG